MERLALGFIVCDICCPRWCAGVLGWVMLGPCPGVAGIVIIPFGIIPLGIIPLGIIPLGIIPFLA